MKVAYLEAPRSLKCVSDIETPFSRARAEWDERYGALALQARNWRYAFAASVLLAGGLVSALIVQTNQRKVIPVIVALDKNTGEPTVVGPVPDSAYKPTAVQIKYFLGQLVRFIRTIPSDQIIIKQNWIRAYKYLRPEATKFLNSMADKDPSSPLKKIGESTVTIQPVSITQIPDSNSYQARWRETVYGKGGMKIDEYSMVAVFTIEIDPPKDDATLNENPLGLFVTSFQWNREL